MDEDAKNCHASRDNPVEIQDGVPSFKESLWPKLKTLTCLDLSECALSELPESLGEITTLQSFQASHNQLTSLPSSLSQLKSLKKLIVSYNQLTVLPDSLATLNKLKILDLSHNEFGEPPSCLQMGCAEISHLDISYNILKEWSIAPLCAYGLQVLCCAHNNLKLNPAWLWGDLCRSLVDLDLSYNSFTNPASMVKTYALWRTGVSVGLKNLNLSNCGLNSNSIHLLHQLKCIQKLNIGNEKTEEKIRIHHRRKEKHPISNFIWQLSFKPFQSISVLTQLFLCGVGLASLPEDINCLEELEVLDCQGNELQWFPDTVNKLSKLRVAVFSQNKLLYLPQDFGELHALEELWLDYNQLEELPSSFADLQRLQWLDLYSNNFENIPPCIDTLINNLSGLDIDYNLFELEAAVKEKAGFDFSMLKILKEAMHRHPQVGVMQDISRVGGARRVCEETDSVTDDCSSSSESYNGNDCESSQEEFEDSRNVADASEINEVEENWDLEDGEDDYFDPTCLPPRTYVIMPKRALIIHEVVLHSNSFCPSDIHPSPSIRAKKDPFSPDDGQFEDA